MLRWSISCILLAGRVARPVASLAWMELCEAQIVLVMGDKILQTGKAKVSFEFSQRKIFRFKSSHGVFHGAPNGWKTSLTPMGPWLLRIGALPVMEVTVKVVASIGISRLNRRCDLKNTKSRGSGGGRISQTLCHYINKKPSFRHLIADEIVLILFHWKVHVLRPSSFLKRRCSRPFIFLPGHHRGAWSQSGSVKFFCWFCYVWSLGIYIQKEYWNDLNLLIEVGSSERVFCSLRLVQGMGMGKTNCSCWGILGNILGGGHHVLSLQRISENHLIDSPKTWGFCFGEGWGVGVKCRLPQTTMWSHHPATEVVALIGAQCLLRALKLLLRWRSTGTGFWWDVLTFWCRCT